MRAAEEEQEATEYREDRGRGAARAAESAQAARADLDWVHCGARLRAPLLRGHVRGQASEGQAQLCPDGSRAATEAQRERDERVPQRPSRACGGTRSGEANSGGVHQGRLMRGGSRRGRRFSGRWLLRRSVAASPCGSSSKSRWTLQRSVWAQKSCTSKGLAASWRRASVTWQGGASTGERMRTIQKHLSLRSAGALKGEVFYANAG